MRGRLNAILWRLPLPHRVAARLSAFVYRNPPVSAELVVQVISTLLAGEVSCWIRGGWGVDALVGQSTRSHDDLDVLVDVRCLPRAVSLLERLGFKEQYKVDSDRPLFSRVVMRDHEVAGHTIDLQPIEPAPMEWAFASGVIGGATVPCVSRKFQVEHRSTYKHRRIDRKDLAVLQEPVGAAADRVANGTGLSAGLARASGLAAALLSQVMGRAATSLIVPVPAAESLLDDSARVRGMPAHITVMYPFLQSRQTGDGARRRLVEAFSTMPAFDLTASSIGRFPNVVYLVPEPTSSFLALTHAVMGLWPQLQPFGGEFEDIVPHLTVAYGNEVSSGSVDCLPVRARVEEVWLMRRRGRGWVRSARIPLGVEGGEARR